MATKKQVAIFKVVTAIACIALFAVLFMCAKYAAGFLFLVLSKMDTAAVSMSTWGDYYEHYSHVRKVKDKLMASAAVSGMIFVLLPALALVAKFATKREMHGSARFAKSMEISASGLLDGQGILVGKYQGKFLQFPGQQFVLLAAPTRAGKGVGIVIPNLLTFPDSIVVLDVKQENYDITAGFRSKHGNEVYLFNPFAEDKRSHRYNPLGYISDDPHYRISDILSIGQAFWSGEGKDPFFDDQARNLFVGLCLYVCETPGLPRTMGELLRQSSGKGQPIKDYLQGIIEARNFVAEPVEQDVLDKRTQMPVVDEATGEVKRETIMQLVPREWDGTGLPPLSDDCVDALNRFTSTSDNTLASILASFNAPLLIWANPIVDAATAANDFDLRDVRKRRMTIYIGITPDHLAEAGLLVNVLFSQLVNLNTKELPQANKALKYQCLLLMDEFTAIGKVKIIAKAVSYMAGYNLRLLPIIQSVAQLASVYGPEDSRTFITNHALQIYFAPREQKDANEYSEMLGFETVKGVSRGEQLGGRGGRSKNESDQRRALLLPQELKELGMNREIVSLENVKPILCDKIRWYADPVLRKRQIAAPAVPLLDLDLHLAQVQKRMRETTVEDIAGGVDLGQIAQSFDSVPTLDGDDEASAEEVQAWTAAFFGSMGVTIGDDVFEDDELDGHAEPFFATGSPEGDDAASPDGADEDIEDIEDGESAAVEPAAPAFAGAVDLGDLVPATATATATDDGDDFDATPYDAASDSPFPDFGADDDMPPLDANDDELVDVSALDDWNEPATADRPA